MGTNNYQESTLIIGEYIHRSKNAHFEFRKKNQRIDYRVNNIFYLKSGRVSVYRQDNDLITISLEAPSVVGLTQMHLSEKTHYLRCDCDCEMWTISTIEAMSLFTHNNLWHHAFDILSHHLHLYFERDKLMRHPTFRGVIHEHLKYIWSMDETIRCKTSVYNFIMSRNHISRSGIHKILHEMIEGGLIIIDRGKLIYLREE
jgi:CRP-like cAMP-binding protein